MNLRNLAVWGVIVMILIALYSVMTPAGAGNPNELSYTQLMQRVDQGQIREANLRGDVLTAKDSSGKTFTAVVPPTSDSLFERMEANGVDLRVDRQGGFSLLGLFFNLLPILLLVAVWIFFMRQMQGGARGAMGFGKSKAKLLTENKHRSPSTTSRASTRPRTNCRRSSIS
jgi:cell division protease FtsH